MSETKELFQEIIEGDTKLLVPKKSLTEKVPPIKPAFFNPKAKTNSLCHLLPHRKIYLPLHSTVPNHTKNASQIQRNDWYRVGDNV